MRLSFLTIFIVLLFSSNIYSKDKITITNGEWPPYFSEYLPNYGELSHLVTNAFKTQNVDVTYKWYPWKRAYESVKTGQYIASVGWSKTKEREKDFLFSKPILSGDVVFFHLKDTSFKWSYITKLKNIKVGTVLGYDYDEDSVLLRKNKHVKIYEVNDETKLFYLLLNKRYDVAILNLEAGKTILNKYFTKSVAEKITYHKKPFHTEHLRVLFSKKRVDSPYYLKKLNKGLEEIKQKK